jgi:hypothetical protein
MTISRNNQVIFLSEQGGTKNSRRAKTAVMLNIYRSSIKYRNIIYQ